MYVSWNQGKAQQGTSMKQELWLVIIERCISSKETPQNLRRFLLYNAGLWVVSARFAISISLFLAKCFLADDFLYLRLII